MTQRRAAPPFDRELKAVLSRLPESVTAPLTEESITASRAPLASGADIDEALAAKGMVRQDFVLDGHQNGSIEVSVIRKADAPSGAAIGVYYIHGGGMVAGDRWMGIDMLTEIVDAHDAVGVTVDYRLAPEYPDPYPVEDCFAGYTWMLENASLLGIDADRTLVMGASAGGGLAAGTVLLSRDRLGRVPTAQLLICPMLDDRDSSESTLQFDGLGVWDRRSNKVGWTALLGGRRGSTDVSVYAAPARGTNFAGLPPTFIDCGSAEVFRDEDIDFARKIWSAGGSAELHVWAGAFHGFDAIAPHAEVSHGALSARANWVARVLGSRPSA